MIQQHGQSRGPRAGRFITGLDWSLLLFLLLLAGIGSAYQSYLKTEIDSAVIRFWDGRAETIELTQDRQWEVEGKLGPITLAITQGQLRIVQSNCPEKICINSGALPKETLAIICVPNGISIEAQSKEGGYDAITW